MKSPVIDIRFGSCFQVHLPLGSCRRLWSRLRRSSVGLRFGLKAIARSTNASTESSTRSWLMKSRIRLEPAMFSSGPTSTSTSPPSLEACSERIAERRKPAHRMRDHERLLKLQFGDEAFDVADLALMAVVRRRFPFAVAMTALVEREAVIVRPQHQAYDVPGVSVQAATVKEQNRRAPGGSPIEVMEPHPMDHDMMRLGENDFGKLSARHGWQSARDVRAAQHRSACSTLLVCFDRDNSLATM